MTHFKYPVYTEAGKQKVIEKEEREIWSKDMKEMMCQWSPESWLTA